MHKRLAPLLGLVALMTAALPASAAVITFYTDLSGAAEAPPNASTGNGWARVTVDDVADTMRVEATFADLLTTSTVAHIHCCTGTPLAGTVGVATPTPTFPGFPAGVLAGAYDTLFDMTQPSSFNASFINGNGGTPAGAFDALLIGMEQGRSYFNLHTTQFPGGEIRGFLVRQQVPEPMSLALVLAALTLVPLGARRR